MPGPIIKPLEPTFDAIEIHRLRAAAAYGRSWLDASANAAEEEALDALCCMPPNTVAGARAAIKYVMAVEDIQQVPAARAYLENLLASPLLR
jgi:hypothetical protein